MRAWRMVSMEGPGALGSSMDCFWMLTSSCSVWVMGSLGFSALAICGWIWDGGQGEGVGKREARGKSRVWHRGRVSSACFCFPLYVCMNLYISVCMHACMHVRTYKH